jgi:hypothetical protein
VRSLTPVLAPKFTSWIFFVKLLKKELHSMIWRVFVVNAMQCAARLIQFWRQKDKNDRSAPDFRKNPYFIEEAVDFLVSRITILKTQD